MAIRQYSIEQLLYLRNSFLVKKPDNLPAIEQWIEYVFLDVDGTREKLRIPHSEIQQQQRQTINAGRQQRPSAAAAEASPMGNFSTGQRPSLIHMKSSAARSGEDITLGPPKTLFASSRTTSRLTDFADKPPTPLTEAALKEETEGNRHSWTFGDKQTNRKSVGTADAEARHTAESWTTARERRALGGEDEKADGAERNGRYSRREREQDGERRNGFGDRQDSRWHRDERRENGEKQGGWRERERERRDRDWGRGHADTKKPEWMDEPVAKQEEDLGGIMGMPKNQEEFEKWKKDQHARNKKSTDIEPEAVPAEPAPPPKEEPSRQVAPLKLEGITDRPFGNWAESKSTGGVPDSAQTPAKSAASKGKTSRFMPLFKKDEPKEEAQSAPARGQDDNPEDKAGFDRILQMLGGTGIGQSTTPNEPINEPINEPASPPPRQVSNGGKPRSRFTGFFDQTPKSPERLQSTPGGASAPFKAMEGEMVPGGRGMTDEPSNVFGMRMAERQPNEQATRSQPPASAMSPEPMMPTNGAKEQRPQSGRMNYLFLDPPLRGASTPDLNIQNLLATRPNQRQQVDNQNSKFLLDLLQTKGSRPSSQHAPPDDNFQLWREPPSNLPETHTPKPRAPPPPGLFEDQLLRDRLMRNHPPEPFREAPPLMPSNEMLGRRTSQRVPPGFYDEQMMYQQQQPQPHHHQRNFTEPARQSVGQPGGRRMSGHPGLPQMQILQQQQPQPPYPGEFLQSPSAAAPPPGFNPHMPRHPPGIHNIPNIFSAPQPPQQQQQRDPPGFAGVGGSGGMMQQTNLPPGAPPGFYGGPQGLPPGFMQMRSLTEGMPAGAAALRGGMARGYEGLGGLGQGR